MKLRQARKICKALTTARTAAYKGHQIASAEARVRKPWRPIGRAAARWWRALALDNPEVRAILMGEGSAPAPLT